MRKIAINRPFTENCLKVTCITNWRRIHEKLLKLSRPQGKIIYENAKKRKKSAILNSAISNVSAIIDLVREQVTSKMQNLFEKDI